MEQPELLPENLWQENNEAVLKNHAYRQKMEDGINRLIIHDFEKLVQLLYRIDVNESKLKAMLADNEKEDAARIITALIIERQLQKIKSKAAFKKDNDSSEESW